MNINELAQRFSWSGFHLFSVGGCVRDELLGRPVHDYDCCTDAHPKDIQSILRVANLPANLVGVSFGVVITQLDEGEVQIATFRSDNPGRRPEVTYTSTFEEDSARRDITLNAIARDCLTNELIDPQNGVSDINNQLIRAVGNPYDRIADDPLRILRVVRFAAQLNFSIEENTFRACAESAQTLATISRERIHDELVKMLLAPQPSIALNLCRDLGLLPFIAPELQRLVGCVDNSPHHTNNPDVFDHTLAVVDGTPVNLVARLAALLHDIGKPDTRSFNEDSITTWIGHEDIGAKLARTVCNNLTFDNDTTRSVCRIVQLHMRRLNANTDSAVRRILVNAGADLDNLLEVMQSDAADSGSDIISLVERIERLTAQTPVNTICSPLNGQQIMAITGLQSGPRIGQLKRLLDEAVVDGTIVAGDALAAENILRILLEKGS